MGGKYSSTSETTAPVAAVDFTDSSARANRGSTFARHSERLNSGKKKATSRAALAGESNGIRKGFKKMIE